MAIDIEFIDQKFGPKNDENAICFKWLDVQREDEEDIAEVNFNENYIGKLIRKFFTKKVTGGLLNY